MPETSSEPSALVTRPASTTSRPEAPPEQTGGEAGAGADRNAAEDTAASVGAGDSPAQQESTGDVSAPPASSVEAKPAAPPNAMAQVNAADAASVYGRDRKYVPYNHWAHDPAAQAAIISELKDRTISEERLAAIGVEPRHHYTHAEFQSQNSLTLAHYSNQGFNCHLSSVRSGITDMKVSHAGEDRIVYPCGKHFAIVDLKDNNQRRILLRNEKVIEARTFDVSSDGSYIAVAERLEDDNDVVSFYRVDSGANVATLELKMFSDTGACELQISSNNKYLLVVTEVPHSQLLLWNLEDLRVIGLYENLEPTYNVQRAAFNGWDSRMMATVGGTQLLVWSNNPDERSLTAQCMVSETTPIAPGVKLWGGLGSLHKPIFSAVLWYDENNLAALTTDGYLIAIEDNRIAYCTAVLVEDRTQLLQQGSGAHTMEASHINSTLMSDDASTAAQTFVEKFDVSLRRRGPMMGATTPARSAASALSQSQTPGARSAIFSTSQSPLSPSQSPSQAGDTTSTVVAGSSSAACARERRAKERQERRAASFSDLAWVSRGLLVCAPHGALVLFDRTYNEACFTQVCRFAPAPPSPRQLVLSLSVSPGETNIVAALSDNTMRYISLLRVNDAIEGARTALQAHQGLGRALDLDGADEPLAQVELPEEGLDLYDVLSEQWITLPQVSFHNAPVTSISVALQRTYLATSSADGHVRVYDYVAQIIIAEKFFDAVMCCAIDPTASFLIVAEDYSTNVHALAEGTLTYLISLPIKGCQGVRYSSNGGRFALSAGNRVHVYNAATFTPLCMLVGHASMVKSVRWCDLDRRLVTADVGGYIMRWDSITGKREQGEMCHRNLILQSAIGFGDTDIIVAIGTTRHARGFLHAQEFTIMSAGALPQAQTVYIRPGMILPRPMAQRKLQVSLLVYAEVSQTLFVGTPTGRILLYSWPLLRSSKPYDIIDAHTEEILQMALSPDERYLFTVGADNLLYVFSTTQLKEGKCMTIQPFDYSLMEAVRLGLVTSQHNDHAVVLKDAANPLRERIKRLATTHEEDKAAIMKSHAEQLETLRRESRRRADKLEERIRALEAETQAIIERGRKERYAADSHFQSMAEEIENYYGRTTDEAMRRLEALKAEKEAFAVKFEAVDADRAHQWAAAKEAIEAARIEKEKQLTLEAQQLRNDMKMHTFDFDAMLGQTIIDGDAQMAQAERLHARQMQAAHEKLSRVHLIQAAGERETERLRREITETCAALEAKDIAITELTVEGERCAAENAALRAENRQKQERINVAEKRVQQLRQQQSALENLRFVLTHQFEQLQAAVGPREEHIAKLDSAVAERGRRLQEVHVQRGVIRDEVLRTDKAYVATGANYRSNMLTLHDRSYGVDLMLSDLARLVEHPEDPKKLRKKLANMISSHAHRGRGGRDALSPEEQAELRESEGRAKQTMAEHRSFLISRYQAIQSVIAADRTNASVALGEQTEANKQLVCDIKALRQSKQQVRDELRALETRLRDARGALFRLADEREAQLLAAQQQKKEQRRGVAGAVSGTMSKLGLIPKQTIKGNVPQPTVVRAPVHLPPLRSVGATIPGTKIEEAAPNEEKEVTTVEKRPAPMPGKPKTTSAHRAALHRSHLEGLIAQLDANTDKMRAQQIDIANLRGYARQLLADEEARLTRALAAGAGLEGQDNTEALLLQLSDAMDVSGHLEVPAGGARVQDCAQGAVDTTINTTVNASVGYTATQPSREGTVSQDYDAAKTGRPMTPVLGLS